MGGVVVDGLGLTFRPRPRHPPRRCRPRRA